MNLLFASLIALSLCLPTAFAAGSEEDESNPSVSAAVQAIKAQDWPGAITLLKAEVAANKGTASLHNYIGFAHRKLGDFDNAFKHYAIALKMNPEHRGAHEYVGQTYLAVGNLEMAKKHLDALDRICFFGCEEYDDLKAAVATYRPK